MRDKIFRFLGLIFLYILIGCSNVFAYTGNGTQSNPYVVSAESGLREILTELPKKSSWVYIAINDTITITKNITVSGGKYRIYAKGADRTIKRSSNMSATINNKNDPQYCMRINNSAEVVMGYNASNYILRLGGNKGYFTNNPCSGWFNIVNGSKLTIGVNGHLTNSLNNEYEDAGSVIQNAGTLVVNGEISNCQSENGGAVSVNGGSIEINSTANIHDCRSTTEGGAIFVNNAGTLAMNGGKIYNCTSIEEGGGIFLGAKCTGKILNGNIYNNVADATGGGVFSGYGAILYIGETNSSGPHIYGNTAGGSGGGVRCNGGLTENAGGTTYFYSGTIERNSSGNVGGGIACGVPGSNNTSKLIIKNIQVSQNTSTNAGGGIWLPQEALGTSSQDVKIEDCYFLGNVSNTQGGGATIHCKATLSNVNINYNEAKGNGGGIYIGENAIVHYKGEKIVENTASGYGNGIYVKGQFQISNKGIVSATNDVYLTKETYIEVKTKISGDTFLNAVIRSAVTTNGTKLVKVNYSGADSETELYSLGNAQVEYNNGEINKRYRCNNLQTNQLLRAGKYAEGIGNEWIIISQEYTVTYNKNIAKNVENMPIAQRKYWNEKIKISDNVVSLSGYKIDEEKYWNYSTAGTGTVVKPGSEYNVNGNRVLYAQWIQIKIQELFITGTDRYYVVGQDITLTPKELLKKVTVEDDLKTGAKYDVFVVDILDDNRNVVASSDNLQTDKYIDTSDEKHYILKIKTKNETGDVTDEEYINVYIMQNDFNENIVRFISIDFVDTLNKKSKWNNSLKNVLLNSLNNASNSGNLKILLSKEKIKNVRDSLKDNNYFITNKMNKELSESW